MTTLFTFFIMLVLPSEFGERFKLDQVLSPEFRRMTSEMPVVTLDSVLIHQRQSILEFDMSGISVQSFTFSLDPDKIPEPKDQVYMDGDQSLWEISNFSYIEDRDLIAVVLGRKWKEAGDIKVEHRLRFVDRKNPEICLNGYDSTKVDADDPFGYDPNVYFRQLISASKGRRLFVNLFNQSNVGEDRPLLREVRMIPRQTSYVLEPVSEPFNMQRIEVEPLSTKYKHRWVVAQDNLLVVGVEMLPARKTYTPVQSGKRDYFKESVARLDLLGWVQPFDKSKSNILWHYSFSRVVGLYEYQEGLLTGYTTPSSPSQAETDAAVNFILNLQKMDEKGRNIGRPVSIPNGYFAGVQGEKVVVIVNDGEANFSLCIGTL